MFTSTRFIVFGVLEPEPDPNSEPSDDGLDACCDSLNLSTGACRLLGVELLKNEAIFVTSCLLCDRVCGLPVYVKASSEMVDVEIIESTISAIYSNI